MRLIGQSYNLTIYVAECVGLCKKNMIFSLMFKGDWIRKRFETPGIISLDTEDKKTLMKRLVRSTGYESYSVHVL